MTPQDFIAKQPAQPWAGSECLGSAHTGLVGPLVGGHPVRIRPHWNRIPPNWSRTIPGDPDAIDGPQRVHAAAVSAKRLRGLMQEIAGRFFDHWASQTPLPEHVDLAQPITSDSFPREGTRLLLTHWQSWFARKYGAIQQAAVANGRWFPPPISLELTHLPNGHVTASAQFAPGYMAQGDVMTVYHPPQSPPAHPPRPERPTPRTLAAKVSERTVAASTAHTTHAAPTGPAPTWVVPPASGPVPPPLPAPTPDQLPEVAQPWAPLGTRLLLAEYVAGFNYHQGHVVIDFIRPGDALTLQAEPTNPHDALAVTIYWHHFKLGYVPRNLNQPVAHLLAMRMPLCARVVATPASQVPWQRVAFAVYIKHPLPADGSCDIR